MAVPVMTIVFGTCDSQKATSWCPSAAAARTRPGPCRTAGDQAAAGRERRSPGVPGATADDVATTIARTIAERPLFCDLISEMSAVLERNVSVATVQAFKYQSLDKVDDLGAVVAERMPDLDGPHERETIAAALIITAGLWPIANPAPRVMAMFAEDPALTRAHVDFEDQLQQLLSALSRASSTQRHPSRQPPSGPIRPRPPRASFRV
jgi:hypothetical protein